MAPPALERLEDLPGAPVPSTVTRERDALRRAAVEVAREAGINHTVISRAIRNGEAFLQAVFTSATEPDPGYAVSARKQQPGDHPGILCNRRA